MKRYVNKPTKNKKNKDAAKATGKTFKKRITMLLLCSMVLTVFFMSLGASYNSCKENGHQLVELKSVSLSRGEERITYFCVNCKNYYVETEYTTAHEWVNIGTMKNPTCTEEGLALFVCKAHSQHYKEDTLPATDHNFSVLEVKPSCIVDGTTTYSCNDCGLTEVKTTKKAQGHSYGDAVITAEPKDGEPGIKTYTCSVCGAVKSEEFYNEEDTTAKDDDNNETEEETTTQTHEHKYELTDETPATCEEDGLAVYTCSCDDSYEEVIPKTGHDYGEWTISKNATLNEDGVKQSVCKNDSSHILKEAIPKGASLEITPASIAISAINVVLIAFFAIMLFTSYRVIKWQNNKRNAELKKQIERRRFK